MLYDLNLPEVLCVDGPVSKLPTEARDKMPTFEDVKNSGTSDNPTEGQSTNDKIFDEFCADRESVAALGVTDEELRELSRASLLGTLTCKEDVLFILQQIRK